MVRRINLFFGSLLVISIVMVSSLSAAVAERFDRGNMNLLAQRGRDFQQRAEERFNKMCEFLGLNEEQKKEVRKLFDERREEMMKLRDDMRDGELSREEAREKMRENSGNYREKLEKLLTEEQKAKLDQWEKENPRRGGRGRSRPGTNS